MALTQLGTVDIDLEQVTAVGPIDSGSEDETLFAFDIHLGGTVIAVVAHSREEAESWRDEAVEDFEPSETFEAGGFTLDLDAVQAVGALAERDAFDDLHSETSFDVYLDGSVAELTFTSLSAATTARAELISAVDSD